MSKKTLFFIILAIVIGFTTYLLSQDDLTSCDNNDMKSFTEFCASTTNDSHALLDRQIEVFYDELPVFKSLMYKAVGYIPFIGDSKKADEKIKQRIAEVWQEHIGNGLEKIVQTRVTKLAYELDENQENVISQMAGNQIEFRKAAYDALCSSLKTSGITIGTYGVKRGLLNEAIAIGAGSAAAFCLSSTLKSNWVTGIIALVVDFVVSNELEASLKPKVIAKLKKDMIEQIDEKLSGKGGLYTSIEQSIHTFHTIRREQYKKFNDAG